MTNVFRYLGHSMGINDIITYECDCYIHITKKDNTLTIIN